MSKASKSGSKPIPKFEEWDVSNPGAGEGFTAIFNAARDEKKNENNNSGGSNQTPNRSNTDKPRDKNQSHGENTTKKWMCCFQGK